MSENVYIGPMCHIGLAHIERDVLVAAGVHIPSGPATHGTADIARPIREQAGTRQVVRIGAGSWIGSAAIVLADVGPNAVIGAGAVVTKAVPPAVIAAGVPAVVVRARADASEGPGPDTPVAVCPNRGNRIRVYTGSASFKPITT